MPIVPTIGFDDIILAKAHIGGFSHDRCKMGLWSIHHVIRKIISGDANGESDVDPDAYRKILECLYMIGVNAEYKDDSMVWLVYGGKTNKKYRRNMPAAKYLFELERYGFVFGDIIAQKAGVPRSKLSVKDLARFSLSYNADDFGDVIFGLKLFSDICMGQSGDCFYTGDIRVAYVNAPKLYAPPVDEVYGFLPEGQRELAYAIHNKLEKLSCVRSLEREYMTRYFHPKSKGQTFATIYAAERLYFLPEGENQQQLTFKFNLRHIGEYTDYLSECTESVRQSIIATEDCGNCAKHCGGVVFTYQGKTYTKCSVHTFRFADLSDKAIENYLALIDLENRCS